MVDSQICFFEYRCNLKLVRRSLIVACLTRYGEFESLYLEVFHERLHAVGDSAEIMVVHLLVFRRVVPHESATGEQKIGSCGV